VLRTEAEFSSYSSEIIQLSREFGDPGLKGQLEIRDNQLFRALDRFLAGEAPRLETELPPSDAFKESVHRWLPVYNISVNMATPVEWVNSRRTTKDAIRKEVEQIYRGYTAANIPFEEIRKREALGFGQGIVEVGKQCLRRMAGLEPIPTEVDLVSLLMPSTLGTLVHVLRERLGLSYLEAAAGAEKFLLSDHVKLTPMADITSKLHAGIAMSCRGSTPRMPKASDSYDIQHIATFAPYVDVMITDGFFADLCNQRRLRVGDPYHTQIRSLGQKEVPDFMDEIARLVREAPQATLADRIWDAIEEGGFHQEMAERFATYLRERRVDPPDSIDGG